jgi:hypothetical protein
VLRNEFEYSQPCTRSIGPEGHQRPGPTGGGCQRRADRGLPEPQVRTELSSAGVHCEGATLAHPDELPFAAPAEGHYAYEPDPGLWIEFRRRRNP